MIAWSFGAKGVRMEIREIKLKISDLVALYSEDEETGRVVAWNGNLDVRPEYQREFVYGEKQRDAVINTVLQGFPLNIMYFVARPDGGYEVLDGQQRIISICRYAQNQFSVKIPTKTGKFTTLNYPNLFDEQRRKFRDYELSVYVCEGAEEEKLDWFQIINIAGEVLETQEIRNALYHGKWLTDAKSLFSRNNCAAYKNYGKYLAGDCIRQKYLETAFLWKADAEGITGKDAVADYMKKHRAEDNADELWNYFEKVFAWVREVFGADIDRSMKGVAWGLLYNAHRHKNLDGALLRKRCRELLADEEVGRKSGVYEYLLTGREKFLNLRAFSDRDKQTAYHRQEGKCALCGKNCELREMQADHILPWSRGGKTVIDNLQMLCAECNCRKSDK